MATNVAAHPSPLSLSLPLIYSSSWCSIAIARLPSPSSTALALAAVTARAAELASEVAAAVHAVELQKPFFVTSASAA